MYDVILLPSRRVLSAAPGQNLLELLRTHGFAPDAPCGGQGTCGKCTVIIDGKEINSCKVSVHSDLTVTIPDKSPLRILVPGEISGSEQQNTFIYAAFDIGTTSVVCSLLDGVTGKRLTVKAAANPQVVYGADVVSRIRSAISGSLDAQGKLIRDAMAGLIKEACLDIQVDPKTIKSICVVGNPAMQQLFLGISPQNLVEIPFKAVLTEARELQCSDYLPICSNAVLQIVPDISGYVGADTVGCIVSTGMQESGKINLLVDIGTNGEMVLGNCDRLVACATAAGPALEGANIRFGMRACEGAIDRVWLEEGEVRFSTIGGGAPVGICGSGLIDAVAAFLELGRINARGRIAPGMDRDGDRILPITDSIYLTQEDIRQVQLAKGAIHAGIRLMLAHLGISCDEINSCMLAGAFGNYLDPNRACRIGLLPPELLGKVRSMGNAAALGAEMMAKDEALFRESTCIAASVESLELASLPEFPKVYASAMRF